MRRVRLGFVCALVALGALSGGASSASAAQGMEIAIQDDGVFVSQLNYDRERALQQARELGATRIRVNAFWWRHVRSPEATTRPVPASYDWSRIDSLIDAAARYGIRVQLTLTGPAPAWGSSNRKISNFGPKADYFGDYARAAAVHFKGRVDRYSIWNEPNYVSWLQPFDLNAALYRELYEAAYKQIKRADPAAAVLIGETAPYAIKKRSTAPIEFLRDVTCTTVKGGSKGSDGSGTDPTPDVVDEKVSLARVSARAPSLERGPCKPLKADGFAHHPYDYRHKPDYAYKGKDNATLGSLGYLEGTLEALKKIRVLRTPKGDTLPLYLTEYGYFNSGKYALPETQRSAYLKKAYTIAQRDKAVVQMLQYGLIAPQEDTPGGFFDLSLVRLDGSPTLPFNSLAAWARSRAATGAVAAPGAPLVLPPAPAVKNTARGRKVKHEPKPIPPAAFRYPPKG